MGLRGCPLLSLLAMSCLLAICCSGATLDEDTPGSRAATAFIGTLLQNARQSKHVAIRAFQHFAARSEPLPYLPPFVLPHHLHNHEASPALQQHVVAHIGCGKASVHPYFMGPDWREIRVDISAGNAPDIVADMVSARQHLGDESVDAVYCAHRWPASAYSCLCIPVRSDAPRLTPSMYRWLVSV